MCWPIMKRLTLVFSPLLLWKCTAYQSAFSRNRHRVYRTSSSSLFLRIPASIISSDAQYTSKISILEGIVQTIQREGTILREDMIETGKLRNKEISSIRRMHSEAQSEAKNIIAGLENDIKQAREREEIKGKRVGHLRKELKLLTGKIDLLHAELDQTSKDLKLANHRLEIARMDQKETRILYEKKLLEMASEANEKAQGMAMDYGVRLSRLELDVKQEKIRRNECEEIATAAVEAAEAKAETLEVSLKESTKKRLRLEAHVKLQLMLLSTLLSRELE